ncbi:MAG: thiamine pyrophosphate-binding protein [Betaproteobacteria bacterium]|nr:thiamine pyrophosphate-binding protein [Gammaproteobacteria bacterium]MDH3436613.1 thiamine pyrophosphate-binding protein [Betaproteobacteria bacterium]
MAQKMTGARLFAQTLKAYGVTHVFFMDAILRRVLAEMETTGIKRILGHSEKAVAYMADGFARVSGRPGICMAQSVGAANLAAAMQDPYLGHSAVIAITGRHVAQNQYRNAYQEVAHEPLYSAVTKFNGRVDTLEQIPHVLRQAFREATTGTPRPVHIDMAGYTGDAVTPLEGEFDVAADEAHTRFPAFRPHPDPDAVQRAVAAIKEASRPVIVADRGVEIFGAGEAASRLAEKIQAPIVATLDARAALSEDHPLFCGMLGLYGRSCANHALAEADLVIYAGSNTSDHTTANWKMPRQGTRTIHIDIDPVEIGRNYPGSIGIQADVRAALEALAAKASVAKRDEWLSRTRGFVDEWRKEAEKARASDQLPLRPERLCRELTDVLPKDAIVIADTGYAALWTGTLLYLRHPTQRYFRAAGSLGWSFPASLGAKCAAPDRPVICFCGDGGFFYHLPELETARRRGIKTVTIVNNNHGLAQGLRNLNIAYQGHDETNKGECYEYRDTDFARIAQSFDCFGVTVEKPQDFGKAFEAALASDLPAVIDVKTEIAGQAQMAWVPA